MTSEERKAYIAYRIEKAESTWQETNLLAQHKLWNTCANRLYYAAFYALTALLLQEGFETQTHKGVKIQFSQHFIKTGRIGTTYNELYADLFNKRQSGDYADLVDWTETIFYR
jgi:uncharacterized protein (UPF0332 family)